MKLLKTLLILLMVSGCASSGPKIRACIWSKKSLEFRCYDKKKKKHFQIKGEVAPPLVSFYPEDIEKVIRTLMLDLLEEENK